MAEFETEEQQIEQLRKWWQENGRAVILGVVLGLGAVGGWRGWVYYSEAHAEAASSRYYALMQALAENDHAAVASAATELLDDYTGTPYAELAALADARVAVAQEDLARARERLVWARDNARQDNIRHIAALRLARVLRQQGAHEAALAELEQAFPDSFLATVEELRGDLFAEKGELDKAREAYGRALAAPYSGANRDVLEMKYNELRDAGGAAS